ncbi:hypothetical protein [Aureimonas jatrophae]|uniref:Uncharacterized protein n=1 Tax=Aureimonas jatrophae TaxID=1166073 RepID=A0A1H0JBM3_9HYPH|nr:hypothetical protein [Aureimonas jatrophae]MBB3951498.1 hypothetical protein [Aureimonas jatrophae]SDO40950.1 hypothetical protein SAMN05192530_10697 [Aureimonas jatrophae]
MSVTAAFSTAVATAVADWGKSAKATFRLSAGADKAVAKMGEDTLELSTKTGNLTVRPPSGRAVAVVGIGVDGVLRIDCGNGPAELGDAKLAEAVAATVRTVRAAYERSSARGNRTSFTLAPAGEAGSCMRPAGR